MQKYRGMMLFMAALVLPLSACMTEDTVSQEDSKQMEQAAPVAPVGRLAGRSGVQRDPGRRPCDPGSRLAAIRVRQGPAPSDS